MQAGSKVGECLLVPCGHPCQPWLLVGDSIGTLTAVSAWAPRARAASHLHPAAHAADDCVQLVHAAHLALRRHEVVPCGRRGELDGRLRQRP